MKILELIRLEETEQGTFGVLKIDKELFCYILEPPDKENKRSVSSIPAQQYICKRIFRESKGYWTYIVENVPNRTAILFHPGTDIDDTEGCIIPGFKKVKYKLFESVKAFDAFMDKMDGAEKIHLTITENF